MSENPIVAVEIQNTQYGDKIVLQSPFDAKNFVKALPFMEYESYDDYRVELEQNEVADGAIQAAQDFDFSNDFATHRSWDPTALGPDTGAWTIDVDAWDETREFFEHCGFEVEVGDCVAL